MTSVCLFWHPWQRPRAHSLYLIFKTHTANQSELWVAECSAHCVTAVSREDTAQMSGKKILKPLHFFSIDDTSNLSLHNYQKLWRLNMKYLETRRLLWVKYIAFPAYIKSLYRSLYALHMFSSVQLYPWWRILHWHHRYEMMMAVITTLVMTCNSDSIIDIAYWSDSLWILLSIFIGWENRFEFVCLY